MKCIFCGCKESKVLDSRAVSETNSIRRRRECERCKKRWTTYEIVESDPIMVEKKNGAVQPFDKKKVVESLIKACEKRPVGLDDIDNIAEKVEKEFLDRDIVRIKSCEIGEKILKYLKEIDSMAYVRYSLVFYGFNSVGDLKEFLNK